MYWALSSLEGVSLKYMVAIAFEYQYDIAESDIAHCTVNINDRFNVALALLYALRYPWPGLTCFSLHHFLVQTFFATGNLCNPTVGWSSFFSGFAPESQKSQGQASKPGFS